MKKTKKLVWSLDDALRKRKELGKEGEVDLERDLKVKQVDTSKDVLVYEYEVQKSPIEKLKSSSYCKIAKWLLVIICILAAAGIIGAIVALALKATTPQTYAAGIGSSCNDTIPCDPTKGQVCSNGVCNCSTTTPTLLSDTCVAVEDYLGECTDTLQCDSSKSLSCVNNLCDCDSLTLGTRPFWSTKMQKCTTCPGTWTYNVSSVSPCYQINQPGASVSWDTARASCVSSNSDLYSASSQRKFELLTSSLVVSRIYYIGGKFDIFTGQWYWNDGTVISTTWSGWCSTADTSGGVKPCLTITYNNGTTPCIADSACATNQLYGSICEIA